MKFGKLLKTLFSGVVGAALFLLLMIFVLAIVKLAYMLVKKDLLLSVYNLGTIVAISAVLGFAYGMRAYMKKNANFRLFKLRWKTLWIDFLLAVIFTAGSYLVLKYAYGITLGWKGVLLLLVVEMVLFYAFSSVFAIYVEHRRGKKHHFKNVLLIVLFNPVFVMIYLALFGMIIYNTVYIPCAVTILDVDRNAYTANTANLGIEPGEKIISIDDQKVSSLYDVKKYMNALESTKQVVVETEENLYYIRTYTQEGDRFMGLILKQEYCSKKY